jgi:hypothetical protein
MIYHLFSDYPVSGDARRRHDLARKTWATQPWIERPIIDSEVKTAFGFPFVGDLIDKGIEGIRDAEIWIFTNSDICVKSDAAKLIEDRLKTLPATYSFRRDFARLNDVLADGVITSGHDYCGSDLFASTAGWWRRVRQDFPPMLLGNEAWDPVMRVLMEEHNKPTISMAVPNIIYHERHASRWENPVNRYSIPSQLHNLRTAWKWLVRRKFNPAMFGIKMV